MCRLIAIQNLDGYRLDCPRVDGLGNAGVLFLHFALSLLKELFDVGGDATRASSACSTAGAESAVQIEPLVVRGTNDFSTQKNLALCC